MASPNLSKSQYLRGLQCHKSLWLLKEDKIKPKAPSESSQVIFDEGTRSGYPFVSTLYAYDRVSFTAVPGMA